MLNTSPNEEYQSLFTTIVATPEENTSCREILTSKLKLHQEQLREMHKHIVDKHEKAMDKLKDLADACADLLPLLESETPVLDSEAIRLYVESQEKESLLNIVLVNLHTAHESYVLLRNLQLSLLYKKLTTFQCKFGLPQHDFFILQIKRDLKMEMWLILFAFLQKTLESKTASDAVQRWGKLLDSMLDESLSSTEETWESLIFKIQLRLVLEMESLRASVSNWDEKGDAIDLLVSNLWISPLRTALLAPTAKLKWSTWHNLVIALANNVRRQLSLGSIMTYKNPPQDSDKIVMKIKQTFMKHIACITNDILAAHMSVVAENHWKNVPEGSATQIQKLDQVETSHKAISEGLTYWHRLEDKLNELLSLMPGSGTDIFTCTDFSVSSGTNISLFRFTVEADKACITRIINDWHGDRVLALPFKGLNCSRDILQARELLLETFDRLQMLHDESQQRRYAHEVVQKLVLRKSLELVKRLWNSREDPFTKMSDATCLLNSIELVCIELEGVHIHVDMPVTGPFDETWRKVIDLFANELLPDELLKQWTKMCGEPTQAATVLEKKHEFWLAGTEQIRSWISTKSASAISDKFGTTVLKHLMDWIGGTSILRHRISRQNLAVNLIYIAEYLWKWGDPEPSLSLQYIKDVAQIFLVDTLVLQDVQAALLSEETDVQGLHSMGVTSLPRSMCRQVLRAIMRETRVQ